MYQPYPSTGQPTGPLRPVAPVPVLAAAKFMYGGAAVSAAFLIAALPFMGDIHGKALGHPLTATPLTITVVIVVFGLVPIALWLWMTRAASQGWNWARILSTVLFGLATLNLTSIFGPPGFRVGFGGPGVGAISSPFVLTWLVGLAVVWLLWRPASSAFFKPRRLV